MRVSLRKRAANRRNALKSTGPKTTSGRRLSSQNAVRHGLSVPPSPQLVGPVQQQLVQLIVSDGFEYEIANDLAGKIIEYERNLLYLKEIYKNDKELANAPGTEKGAAIIQQKEIDRVSKVANSQRYFKRASNQLIKTLKRL